MIEANSVTTKKVGRVWMFVIEVDQGKAKCMLFIPIRSCGFMLVPAEDSVRIWECGIDDDTQAYNVNMDTNDFMKMLEVE